MTDPTTTPPDWFQKWTKSQNSVLHAGMPVRITLGFLIVVTAAIGYMVRKDMVLESTVQTALATSQQVQTLTVTVDKLSVLTDNLASKVIGNSEGGWHRYQQQIFCREFQRTNERIGAECPDLEKIPWRIPTN